MRPKVSIFWGKYHCGGLAVTVLKDDALFCNLYKPELFVIKLPKVFSAVRRIGLQHHFTQQ